MARIFIHDYDINQVLEIIEENDFDVKIKDLNGNVCFAEDDEELNEEFDEELDETDLYQCEIDPDQEDDFVRLLESHDIDYESL